MNTTKSTTTNVVHISEGHRLRAARQADGRELRKISTSRRVDQVRRDGRAVRRRPSMPAA